VPPVDFDVDFARDDELEVVAAVALREDDRPRGQLAVAQGACEMLASGSGCA
jgi:hypothetical protein